MTKKIRIRKVETEIPSDAVISQIATLSENDKHVTLEVTVQLRKIQEIEDTTFALLDIKDKTASMQALLFGDDGKEFASLLNSIKNGFTYRIGCAVATISDDTEDVELPFIDDVKGKKMFLIRALQYYPDSMFNTEVNELFGVSIEVLFDYNLKQAYDFVKENTDYLDDNILINDVRDIQFSLYGNVIILLSNGDVILDGNDVLSNIKLLSFRNGYVIFAISNDRIIRCLTSNIAHALFMNNYDSTYKKILVTPLVMVALTNDGDIKFYGDILDTTIDYHRFMDIEDVGYVEENNDIVVIKDGLPYSLLYEHDYFGEIPDVLVEGELNDVVII
jgi:hypothetical protein